MALISALLMVTGGASAAPESQGSGPTLSLWAGQGEGVVSMEGFVVPQARVAVGTTVTWTVGSDEMHTVTFLAGAPRPAVIVPQPEDPALPPMANPMVFFPNPAMGPWDGTSYVNSSPLGRGQEFSVTFSQPGTYDYVCLFHPPMLGQVVVVAAGSSGVTTQADVDAEAASHFGTVHQSQVDQIYAQRSTAGMVPGVRGNTWFVRAGTDWKYGHLDVAAFLPGDLTVKAGDTVVWSVDHGYPHTVTFLPAGAPHPDEFVVQIPGGPTVGFMEFMEMMASMPPPDPAMPMDPSMLPRLIVGPGFVPSGGPTYNGRVMANSGLVGSDGNDAMGPMSYALTFDTPGTYDYICLLHEPLGMKGTITVT